MIRKLFFPALAILLLVPWPVAYAYDNAVAGAGPVQVAAAEPSVAPEMAALGNAVGGITSPGTLFYVDATGAPGDVSVALYLTNADELIHYYRYLILKVGVYVQAGADWQPAASGSGELFPDTYLTLRNGRVSFTLPGYARYKVTIDSGCFYFSPAVAGGSISPKFYLTVE